MPAPLPPGAPSRIAGYTLTGLLGEGGQGVVYLGEDDDGRQVAIKVMHAGALDGRLRKEAEAAQRVASFCTAAVLEVELTGERPHIVSEYVPGESLQARVRAEGPRSGGALHRLALATATALAAIHRAGVVHRDFKPGNVLLGPEGPVVIDFGIARAVDASLTRSGVVGTPAYMSPEQVAGHPVGPPSDVFSWAGTVLFAATGRSPFSGVTVPEVLSAVLYRHPDLSSLPEPLRGLVGAALVKDPRGRPTAGQLVQALSAGAQEPAVRQAATIERRRPRTALRAGVAGTLAVAALAVLVTVSLQDSGTTGTSGTSASSYRPPTTWRPQTGGWAEPVREAGDRYSRVRALAIATAGGRPVALTGEYDEVRGWDLTTAAAAGEPLKTRVDTLAALELDGRQVTLIGGDESLGVWDSTTRERLSTMRVPGEDQEAFGAIATAGGKLAVTGGAWARLVVWDLKAAKQVRQIATDHTGTVLALAVSGRTVVSAGGDATVQRFDLDTGEPLGEPMIGHSQAVAALVVTDGLIVSAGYDGTVRRWDLESGRPVGAAMRGHDGAVTDLALAEVGGRRVLVSGGADGTLRMWDPRTGERLGQPIDAHQAAGQETGIAGLEATTVDGAPAVVTTGQDMTLRLWRLELP
ncbi:WD40 repeat domain-containing serine/threonine protein kinase [Nonomuraea soli]|uniref:WD40 repeat protein/predicted Ser/Thr protein kinase n=1 Tax=Nonomuraea soli TaxID=1032476 RepID=A0A7W0CJQ1_9ACTN|nr:serine/threonine-protein kinase [Nonomuraea soli]MBA2892459.1 WD40 repeat protein/predicted Ser/Thr protein kinase [Nonomuraea soli]